MKYLALLILWNGASCSDADQFPQQLDNLVRRVRMPESRIRLVPGFLESMKIILSKRWPGCDVYLLGSMAYSLEMAYSDLDCFLYLPDHNSTSNESLMTILEEAKELLQQHSDFVNFYTWTNLTVPVLTFDHEPTKFDVDLSFNTFNEWQRSQLVRFLTILDKKAYYLAVIAKYWSRFSNRTGEYLLRNHGMLLLVIFYLQQKNVLPSIASLQDNTVPYMIEEWNFGFDEKSYETQNDDSISTIIGGFFKYYSEFDFDNYIISTYAGYPIQKSVFEHLETVPAEFVLYKENVMSTKSQPLKISPGLMVQDLFVHNQCINNTVDTQPDSPFILIFKDAARKFQEDEVKFIKDLRKGKSYVQSVIEVIRNSRINENEAYS